MGKHKDEARRCICSELDGFPSIQMSEEGLPTGYRQTLGYLKATVGHGLLYQKCQEADRGPDGNLAFCRDANTLEVHSDASFGPGGERSHQGLLAVWAGGLIQWESIRDRALLR